MFDKIIRYGSRGMLIGKKYLPQILMVVGTAGSLVTTGLLIKKTLDVKPVIDDLTNKENEIKNSLKVDSLEKDSKDQLAKELVDIYKRKTFTIVKAYSTPITIGVLSLSCFYGSHKILNKRNVALVSLYTAIDSAFKKYRSRVVEEFDKVEPGLGKSKDAGFMYGTKTIEDTDEKTGEKRTIHNAIEVKDEAFDSALGITRSIYGRWFKCGETQEHDENAHYNLAFLLGQQQWFNTKLQRYGHVFLNEVYDALGYAHTSEGAIVGWVANNKNGTGDGYIDFSIYDIVAVPQRKDFVNGVVNFVYLDFNVDGPIFDLI